MAHAAGEGVSVDDSTLPGNCTSFTEVVETTAGPYISGVDGHLYRPTPGTEGDWEKTRLAKTRIAALAVGTAGLAAVTDAGVLYGEVSAFDEGGRTKYADLDITDAEELAARGETFVAVGRDGGIAVVDAEGNARYPDPAPGVTFYGAERTAEGELVLVGSEGTILSGTPKGAVERFTDTAGRSDEDEDGELEPADVLP